MHCLDCDYSLHNLSENRCPECGRAFDPDDPTTYRPLDENQRRLQMRQEIKGIAIAVGFVIILAMVFFLIDLFVIKTDGPCCSGAYLVFALISLLIGLRRIDKIKKGFYGEGKDYRA